MSPPVVPHWPASLFPESSRGEPRLVAAVISGGGPTMAGQLSMARTDGGGLWAWEFNDMLVHTPDQIRALRALDAICEGGAQPICVPLCETRYMPAPLDGNGDPVYSHPTVLHESDNPFLGGHGYHVNAVQAKVHAAAALRATTLAINVTEGSALRGGEFFSIDDAVVHRRLYEVRTVKAEGGNIFTCTIRPPLRAAAAADSLLFFDRPGCVMQLASPDALKRVLEGRRVGRPSVAFVEYFGQFPDWP